MNRPNALIVSAIFILSCLLMAPASSWSQASKSARRSKPTPPKITRAANIPRLVIQSSASSIPWAVAYSPNGRYVLSGGVDRTLKLWDVATGAELRTFSGHRGYVTSVAFSSDGRFALSGSNDKTLKLWEVETGKEILTLQGDGEEIASVALSPNGRYGLSGSHSGGRNRLNILNEESGSVQLWDLSTGKELKNFSRKRDSVPAYAVVFSANGRYAASAGDGGEVCLWQLLQGKLLKVYEAPESAVINSVAFSPGDKFLVAGGNGELLVVWNLQSGAVVWSRPTGDPHDRIEAVAFSPDGRYVATGGGIAETGEYSASLKLWDAASGKELKNFAGHQSRVNSVAFSADGRELISASDDRTIKRWNVSTGVEIATIRGYANGITAVAASQDGRYLLTGSGDYLSILIKTLNVLDEDRKQRFLRLPMETLALWDLSSGKVVRMFRAHHLGVTTVAISPDNARALSGGFDGSVKLWDLASGAEIRTLVPEDTKDERDDFNSIAFVSFSPDGKYLLARDAEGMATIWEASTGVKIQEFGMDGNAIPAFSPDSKSLVFESRGKVAVFDVATGNESRSLEDFAEFESFAFTPDGRRVLAAGSEDLALWELATGKIIKSFTGFPENTKYVKFSPDGRYALLSRLNRPSKIWDLASGKETQTLAGSDIWLRSETFSADGRYVLSGSDDGTVRIWEVATESPDGNPVSSQPLCTLTSFMDETWAVVDSAARYDASQGGDIKGLHWVVNNEPIVLTQLKDRYFEPGLLAKLLSDDSALRDVSPFRNLALYPLVKYEAPTGNSDKLHIQITDRGGGIGRVSVSINNKELTADALSSTTNLRTGTVDVTVDLSRAHAFAGKPNRIQVRAWNAENYLVSRPVERDWLVEGTADNRAPELYAIVAGISNYASPKLRLRFAAKDAEDIATAIALGGKRLFGADKVHLTLLNTAGNPNALLPTKANFQKAFESARQSRPQDLLIVYLAGHGLVVSDKDGDHYCYLTRDAIDKELADTGVRGQSAITSDELTDWIKQIPALKQVMILDTCAAEGVAQKLFDRRQAPAGQVRALERFADRTGFHVLMGSAANAASYEASQYGQGLLTYALLQGMKGGALREDEWIDVSRLFQYAADEVPQLALRVGGIQQPHIAALRADSFDIGQLNKQDKAAIPLASVLPVILPPRLTNTATYYDDLKLSQALRKRLLDASYLLEGHAGGPLRTVFIDTEEMSGAFFPSGTYVIKGERIEVKLVLVKDDRKVAKFELEGSTRALNELTEALINKITEEAEKLYRQ